MAGAELASDGPLRPAAEPPSASSSREPLAASRLVRPPMTPRPHAQQRWVHSCCSVAKLERALSDSSITAIEADIMLGTPQAPSPVMVGRAKRPGVIGSGSVGALVDALVPVMAHPRLLQKLSRSPPPPKSDLTFVDFLERCIEDGSRHLKLDFKHMGAVEPCLQLLASKWHLLHSNGQAVWLNADVLPGPNARGAVDVNPAAFLPLCSKWCPYALLSLGWRVGPIGPEEAYTEHDMSQMERLVAQYSLPGSSLVFATSLRYTTRALSEVSNLLNRVPNSQLLLWTGTGELPVQQSVQSRVSSHLAAMGHLDRIGYDAKIADSCCALGTAHALDCTFFWSRWTRWLCCPAMPLILGDAVQSYDKNGYERDRSRAIASGERQSLIGNSSPPHTSTGPIAPIPQRIDGQRDDRQSSSDGSACS